jgi:hypothetical protein
VHEIDYFNETVVLAKQRLTHAILAGKVLA